MFWVKKKCLLPCYWGSHISSQSRWNVLKGLRWGAAMCAECEVKCLVCRPSSSGEPQLILEVMLACSGRVPGLITRSALSALCSWTRHQFLWLTARRLLSHWSRARVLSATAWTGGDQNKLGTQPKNTFYKEWETHFLSLTEFDMNQFQFLDNWDCDNCNVTTMNLSSGKYDIFKMSIFETFQITGNYFLTSSSVCSWRHCTQSLWVLHFIFCPPCRLWWWLLVLWDEMEPQALTWSRTHFSKLKTKHSVTTLTSHQTHAAIRAFVLSLSLSRQKLPARVL